MMLLFSMIINKKKKVLSPNHFGALLIFFISLLASPVSGTRKPHTVSGLVSALLCLQGRAFSLSPNSGLPNDSAGYPGSFRDDCSFRHLLYVGSPSNDNNEWSDFSEP